MSPVAILVMVMVTMAMGVLWVLEGRISSRSAWARDGDGENSGFLRLGKPRRPQNAFHVGMLCDPDGNDKSNHSNG